MKKGFLYLLFAALSFGSFEVVSKMISGVEAISINFMRFLFGGLFLLPFAIKEVRKKKITFTKKDILYFFIMGILLVPISMVLLQVAIQNSSASLVAFIFSSNPIFIAVFAYFILQEKPDKFVIASIIIGITGLSILLDIFSNNFNWYIAYAVIAIILFALYVVSMRKVNKKYGNLVSYTFTVFFGTSALFVYLLSTKKMIFTGVGDNIFKLCYIGIICSGLAYLSYFKGMDLTSTNMGSVIFFFKPIVAITLAVIILNESIKSNYIIGAVLVVFSSILMFYGKERANLFKVKANSSK